MKVGFDLLRVNSYPIYTDASQDFLQGGLNAQPQIQKL